MGSPDFDASIKFVVHNMNADLSLKLLSTHIGECHRHHYAEDDEGQAADYTDAAQR